MELFDLQQWCYVLRMIIAGCCGFVIGLERKNRSKEAGVRTHAVVACASALMMIISKYGFSDTAANIAGMRGADGARIAAQVVSGIGFLGAGMIFVHKNTITGLTTAAGVWATAGVGLAIGAGMYVVGICAAFIIVLTQIILHGNFRWLKPIKQKKLIVKGVDIADFQRHTINLLHEAGINIADVSAEKTEDGCNYTFIIEMPNNVYEENILNLFDFRCKIDNV